MKKTTTLKILSSLMVILLIGTIGAAMVSAEDTTNNLETEQKDFENCPKGMRPPPFLDELTDDQQEELKNLVETLKEEGATREEIHTAIQEKLEEWDITIEPPTLTDEERDEILAKKIEKTEQRLEIMNRVQELRDQGYDYEDIKDIIKEEYDIEPPLQPHCRKRMRYRQWAQKQEQ
jgi:DNA-binding transcriptional regulator YhcF (GntR family)